MNYQNDDDRDGYVAEVLQKNVSHLSVKDRGIPQDSFNFQRASAKDIQTRLERLKTNKTPGYVNIPAKLLKIGASVLCYPIQQIANMCIYVCLFPASLK